LKLRGEQPKEYIILAKSKTRLFVDGDPECAELARMLRQFGYAILMFPSAEAFETRGFRQGGWRSSCGRRAKKADVITLRKYAFSNLFMSGHQNEAWRRKKS